MGQDDPFDPEFATPNTARAANLQPPTATPAPGEELNPFATPQAQMTVVRPKKYGPEGFGGALILVVIGLFVAPILRGYGLISDLSLLDNVNVPEGLRPVLWVEACANGIMGLAAVLLLVLLFQRLRVIPKLMIGYYAANVAIETLLVGMMFSVDGLPPSAMTSVLGEWVKAAIWSFIWGMYFLLSDRVRNTFNR